MSNVRLTVYCVAYIESVDEIKAPKAINQAQMSFVYYMRMVSTIDIDRKRFQKRCDRFLVH